jgi:hypothetical protein
MSKSYRATPRSDCEIECRGHTERSRGVAAKNECRGHTGRSRGVIARLTVEVIPSEAEVWPGGLRKWSAFVYAQSDREDYVSGSYRAKPRCDCAIDCRGHTERSRGVTVKIDCRSHTERRRGVTVKNDCRGHTGRSRGVIARLSVEVTPSEAEV